MRIRYNIALTPMHNGRKIIALSEKFKDIADQYLLGDNSLPHVTLCQFIANEDEIPEIWNKACDSLNQKMINLVFKEFSCITFNDSMFWVSLLPNNSDKLMEMSCIITDIVKSPVSKSHNRYDPHMTLVNTKNKEYKKIAKNISESYKLISDKFILSLGQSDNIGQYTKMIYRYEAKSVIKSIFPPGR